jgi:hypothetical protein
VLLFPICVSKFALGGNSSGPAEGREDGDVPVGSLCGPGNHSPLGDLTLGLKVG